MIARKALIRVARLFHGQGSGLWVRSDREGDQDDDVGRLL